PCLAGERGPDGRGKWPYATSPQKISFAEISIPIKQESVRNGFHPDIILRKGPVSVEISNSVSAELLSRIGDIFHAE
ncbi:MAG: hypothetical protein ACLVKQ_14685, partial [Blautia massiliensis (ex Durand et al. 2017)]